MTKRIVELLTRPMVAGFVAAITTALLLPPATVYQTVEKVLVRDPIAPQVLHEFQVVNRTSTVCDTETVIRAINEVLRSQVRTGEAGFSNRARAKAKGNAAASAAQSGVARSGDAVAGIVMGVLNVCGNVEIVAHNQVSDVVLSTGDAVVTNEADVTAQIGRAPTTTSTGDDPPPLPEDGEPDAADEEADPEGHDQLD